MAHGKRIARRIGNACRRRAPAGAPATRSIADEFGFGYSECEVIEVINVFPPHFVTITLYLLGGLLGSGVHSTRRQTRTQTNRDQPNSSLTVLEGVYNAALVCGAIDRPGKMPLHSSTLPW